jgi:hypothetical protein
MLFHISFILVLTSCIYETICQIQMTQNGLWFAFVKFFFFTVLEIMNPGSSAC